MLFHSNMPLHKDVVLDRKSFQNMLQDNQGFVIMKFGATWCEPCKRIESVVEERLNELGKSEHVSCMTIDIDDSFDLYAFLKMKKVVKSIPAILCYVTGNPSVYPDDLVNTSDTKEVNAFFDRCKDCLLEATQPRK